MNASNSVYSIIGVEIMSFLVCLVILYGNVIERHEKTKRNRLFSYTVLACMLALAADAVSWIFDGREDLNLLLYVSTVISLIMTLVIDIIFIYYITEYTRERQPVSFTLARIFSAVAAVLVLLIVASSGTGTIFSFTNGVYQEGPYYSLYLIVNLLLSLFCLGTTVYYMRFLSAHDRIAYMSYIIFPMVAGGINLFYEEFSYAYPAIVLAMAMLYVMIQSERQDQLEEEGRISYYAARHDALTGLFNRMAFEEKLKELSLSDVKVGTIFADVNGLKYANDNFGHEAGDHLLTRFSELLCRNFRKEEVFRISGDEFVVLMGNVEENIVLSRVKTLQEAMTGENDSIASIGFSYGNGGEINELIKKAESEMYLVKEEFHKTHPEMSRR